ncbi:hypothetical protein vseg_004214 [Gypsophila vaccaria]
MLFLMSLVLCDSARTTFFVSDEKSIGQSRMLRGISLNDYEDVGANRGHDPDNRGGGHDSEDRGVRNGWRRGNP